MQKTKKQKRRAQPTDALNTAAETVGEVTKAVIGTGILLGAGGAIAGGLAGAKI